MVARRLGIHATDLASMDLLNSAESPVTPKVLSEHLGISTGSATAAIDRLERAGYTRRVPNPSDRRGVILEPTNHQQEKLSAAYKHFNQQYEELIRDVPDDELEAVIRFLGGIWVRAALDQSGKMPKAVGNIAFCV